MHISQRWFLQSMLLACLGLLLVGWVLTIDARAQTTKLMVFTVVAIIFCHGVAWLARGYLSGNQIRSLDYIFVVLGLLGLGGIVEVQSRYVLLNIDSVRNPHFPYE